MPEIASQSKHPVEIPQNTMSNPAKLLAAYMRLTGTSDAKQIAADLDIPIRTVQRLKLECATAIYGVDANSAKCANSAIYGVSEAPNAPYMAPPIAPIAPPVAFSEVGTEVATRAPKEFPTEIVIPKPSIVAQARDDAGRGCDLKILSEKIFAAAGPALACQSIAPGLAHMGVPEMWLDQGADLERDIVQTLQVAAVKYRGRNIKSWDYFSGMVSDAKARRERGLPPARISTGPSNVVEYKPMPKPSRPPNYRFEDDAELVAEILRVNGECHA